MRRPKCLIPEEQGKLSFSIEDDIIGIIKKPAGTMKALDWGYMKKVWKMERYRNASIQKKTHIIDMAGGNYTHYDYFCHRFFRVHKCQCGEFKASVSDAFG